MWEDQATTSRYQPGGVGKEQYVSSIRTKTSATEVQGGHVQLLPEERTF